MIFWLLFREAMNILELFLELDFYQDWWWNLALVVVAFYIGIAGYSQQQPTKIYFENSSEAPNLSQNPEKDASSNEEQSQIANDLKRIMNDDRLYLQPDLNLQELAQHLQVSAAQLSSTINQGFQQNFNDYINSLRLDAFIEKYQDEENQKYTLLALAFDSGFNSKATFNRAFKKIKGCSPKEYFEKADLNN